MAQRSFSKSAVTALMFLFLQGGSAHAVDASFACKVLLCGASINPSWTAIPYCVPIMQQALAMQAMGIAVGLCAEAMNGAGDQSGQQNPANGSLLGPNPDPSNVKQHPTNSGGSYQ